MSPASDSASRFSTIANFARDLRAKRISALDVTDHFIRSAEADEQTNAYVSRHSDSARQAAVRADRELADGIDRGPLHGVPMIIKDNLATKDGTPSAGSKVQLALPDMYGDAHAVSLLRRAGAVILGTARLSEFGIGVPNGADCSREPRNPVDPEVWCGGSSSGSAVAVAAGLAGAALGTDTGGSVRIPAAFCGVSGFKPTTGLVSVSGLVPLSVTLDCVGPIARSAADCALVLEAISTANDRVPARVDLHQSRPLTGLQIGVDPLINRSGLDGDPLLLQRLEAAGATLRDLGAEIVDIEIPRYEDVSDAALIIMLFEAYQLHRQTLRDSWTLYGRSARNRIASGSFLTHSDAVNAHRVLRIVAESVDALMGRVDVVVTPTTGFAGPRLDSLARGDNNTLQWLFTRYWNAMGSPCLSIPIGNGDYGLPLSMQIAGRHFEDATVLAVGAAFQSATTWHSSALATVKTSESLDVDRSSTPHSDPTADGIPRDALAVLRVAGLQHVVGDDLAEIMDGYGQLRDLAMRLASLASAPDRQTW